MKRPYFSLSDYLKKTFGEKVYRVTLDAGLTCPTRDGTKGSVGCTYCNAGALRPAAWDGRPTVEEQLATGMERVKRRYGAQRFIAYFQLNTSTYGPLDYLEKIYNTAAEHRDIAALAISTRPDCLGTDVLDLMAEIKRKKHLWLELGLQSANRKTLELIMRGHDEADFARALLRACKRNIDVCAHVILGLPGEDESDMMNTMCFLSRLPLWGIKFHQLQVLKNTPLEMDYRKGRVKVLDLEGYIRLVIKSLEMTRPGVVVHRLFGDAPEGLLVAPRWGVTKGRILRGITEEMERRGTRQGAALEGVKSPARGEACLRRL